MWPCPLSPSQASVGKDQRAQWLCDRGTATTYRGGVRAGISPASSLAPRMSPRERLSPTRVRRLPYERLRPSEGLGVLARQETVKATPSHGSRGALRADSASYRTQSNSTGLSDSIRWRRIAARWRGCVRRTESSGISSKAKKRASAVSSLGPGSPSSHSHRNTSLYA